MLSVIGWSWVALMVYCASSNGHAAAAAFSAMACLDMLIRGCTVHLAKKQDALKKSLDTLSDEVKKLSQKGRPEDPFSGSPVR